MKKIRVLHGKLLIKREKQPEMVGSFYVPTNANKKEMGWGEIINGNADLPKGTRIIFNKYAGTDIDLGDGNEYLILDQRDIIGEFK